MRTMKNMEVRWKKNKKSGEEQVSPPPDSHLHLPLTREETTNMMQDPSDTQQEKKP